MSRTAAFWERRREDALQLARDITHKQVVVLRRIAGLRRKLRRLNQGISVLSYSRRAWKRYYTKDLLVELISLDKDLVSRYQHRQRKYEKRALYCEVMLKQCREKTLWDKILQKSAF